MYVRKNKNNIISIIFWRYGIDFLMKDKEYLLFCW